MAEDVVIDALAGRAGSSPVGVTWVPEPALDALFWGKAATPAEALSALAQDVPLDFAFVPGDAEWAADAVARLHAVGALPVWTVSGPLGRVEERLGAVETLRMSAAEPSDLAAIIDRQLHAALDEVRRGADLGVRAVVIADDLAGEEGPLVSPDYALDALVPCYRRLAQQVIEGAAIPLFHSDGDVRPLLPALAHAGFAAIHPGGLTSNRLAAVAGGAWAKGMVVVGGLRAARLLSATREEATAAVALSGRGPLLISDDGGIASAEQLAAFVTAARTVRTLLGQSSR